MTDEQFTRLAEWMARLIALQEETCGALGEANHHLRHIAAGSTAAGSSLTLADDEEEGKAQLYVVRRKQDGELGIMFYSSAPLVVQPTGKLYHENLGILTPHCQIDIDEPVWTGKDSPSRDLLEKMPGYLRPLGGTLHFVKKERPARNGGFAAKPIVRIISFTPDAAPDSALPRQPPPQSPTPQPPPAAARPPASLTSQPPPAPPPSTSQTERAEAARRLQQTVGAALGLTSADDVARAGSYIVARWAAMQKPPLATIAPAGATLSELSTEQIEQLRQHLLTHPNRWRATWRTAQHNGTRHQ